ncbi:hypothetical protein LB452_00375 [Psychroflexus sp. CAK8W]|uniref:Uncharacterized protein n=1 Tax=Psychroflexus longus TaxID=2873596 RepID=A0ABS7XFU5_9FLAO|nr:hypothetical protein [Psychroflexus longus]MBZ9777363.1 hypothetical protein [Psychroflexus longus]
MKLLFFISGPILIVSIYLLVNFFIKNRLKSKTRTRRFLITISASILIYLILFLSTVFIYYGYTPQLDFNQQVWMEKPLKRHLMLEDLIEKKLLTSYTTEEVKAKLGEPTTENDSIFEYKILEAGKLDIYENRLLIYHENKEVSKVDLKKRKLH